MGDYQGIISMCYWDYLSILNTMKLKNQRASGEEIIHEKVPESNKDMIKRLKEL